MRKFLIACAIVLGFAGLVGVSALAWDVFTTTEPYLVKPLSMAPAPGGVKAGHSLDSGTRTLSVISGNDITVVADPGVSFHYRVIWLVERPRKDGADTLMEFKYDFSKHAAGDQVRPLGSPIPTDIQQVADGRQW